VRGVVNRFVARVVIAAAVLSLPAIRGEAAGDDASAGAVLFADRCAGCHGRNGKGGGMGIRLLAMVRGAGGPIDFTDSGVMANWPDERIARVIREGGKAAGGSTLMPAYEDSLAADKISDLVAFIRSLRQAAARAEPASQPDRFELSLGMAVGIPRGYVQVRENQLQGTHLSLHGDLGIDTVESVTLGAAYHLSPNDTLRLNFDSIFLYGSSRLSEDVLFNGALLQGGTTAESRPEFFRLTGLYERRLFDLAGGGHLAGDIGLTYVFLTYKINGTLSPQSTGGETKEDFLTQELPVPMLGFSLEQPLSERTSFVCSLLGGYLPMVDSLRQEGGDVKLSQTNVDVLLGVRYQLTPALDLRGGYAFHYFTQYEKSNEDGNYFQLWDNDLTLALVYRF
jgi:mono/diheme cytochrome c family protein